MDGSCCAISVIVATHDALRDARPCLEALEGQRRGPTEVLVVDGAATDHALLVEREWPWARLARGGAGRPLAELRAIGLARATGDLVAFTDVHCKVSPGWVERLREEPWDDYAAVGGVLAPVPRSTLADWAAFLCEYGPHLPSQPAGPAAILPGNNVAFRRDALERAGLIGEREFWKVFALWRLAALGERFWTDPSLIVRHDREISALEFARQRYLNARCFGANRAASRSWRYRLARAASCPIVPYLLTARLIGSVSRDPVYRRTLVQSLPFSLAFNVAWAWGELHGYLIGGGNASVQLV